MKDINEFYCDPLYFSPKVIAPKHEAPFPRLALKNDELVGLPYTADENGRVMFDLFYPNAKTVKITTLFFGETELKKCGDYFRGELQTDGGFVNLTVIVDGNKTLDPYLPIGIGDNAPINYIDVPDGKDFYAVKDVPHGSVVHDFVFNKIVNRWERILIYLPPEYFAGEQTFPVLYLQHGHGENEVTWVSQGKMNFIFDNLIAEGKAVPAVVVMCNGMQAVSDDNGAKTLFYKFDEFLINAVIPHIEGRYKVYTDAKHRAMAGLSMGSIQTSRMIFTHPEMFAYAGIFSGFISDLLSDDNGHLSPENIAKFKKYAPFFYRAYGDQDIFKDIFDCDTAFAEKNGIQLCTKVHSGRHEWNVWRECFYDFIQLIFREGN